MQVTVGMLMLFFVLIFAPTHTLCLNHSCSLTAYNPHIALLHPQCYQNSLCKSKSSLLFFHPCNWESSMVSLCLYFLLSVAWNASQKGIKTSLSQTDYFFVASSAPLFLESVLHGLTALPWSCLLVRKKNYDASIACLPPSTTLITSFILSSYRQIFTCALS